MIHNRSRFIGKVGDTSLEVRFFGGAGAMEDKPVSGGGDRIIAFVGREEILCIEREDGLE